MPLLPALVAYEHEKLVSPMFCFTSLMPPNVKPFRKHIRLSALVYHPSHSFVCRTAMVSVVYCGNMTVIKLFVGNSALHGADRARLLIDDLVVDAVFSS
jgi:hypothetical protein